MRKIKVYAPAKINLFLNILSKDDKYHKMHMINTSIDLYDILTIEIIDKGIILECNNKDIPIDKSNSVYKAIEVFLEYTNINSGIKVYINKHIPIESGLGGESTDAAATLVGLNKLLGTNLSEEELLKLGSKIGSDVPYSIKSRTQEVEGYGEILKDYNIDYKYFLVIKPNISCSTKDMFKKYDKLNQYKKISITIGHNDFTKVVDKRILSIINKLSNSNALYSFLSGSGSSVIGIYDNEELLDKDSKLFKNNEVYKTSIVNGIKIEEL